MITHQDEQHKLSPQEVQRKEEINVAQSSTTQTLICYKLPATVDQEKFRNTVFLHF